jgi:hypothetical protein
LAALPQASSTDSVDGHLNVDEAPAPSGDIQLQLELANLDAIAYAKSNPNPSGILSAMEIGYARAAKHNFIGTAAGRYGARFAITVMALYEK